MAGFRAPKLANEAYLDTFPGICPVVSRRDVNFVTVAGAAPTLNRLPNYPQSQAEGHLEHGQMIMNRDLE